MCDTLVALSNATKDNSVIFAKNSDREPNEPQIVIRIPSKINNCKQKVKCTYIEVEQKEHTNEVILIKPHWMWGAEMGVNSKGLVIGNEAVFTKEKQETEALLGMDILRLALENCDNAAEGVNYITALLEQYGQGGKAAYKGNLRYHNSFIIADPKEAYVLETAGRLWVTKRINSIYTISNSLTISNDFETCSADLVENAINQKSCRTRADFSFKGCYEDKLYSFASKGDFRKKHTESYLTQNLGNIDVASMMHILRDHGSDENVSCFKTGSMKSICMHAGGIISSQTTGSIVVQLKDGDVTLWITGSSLPCISLFKPYWFISDSSHFYSENQQESAVKGWLKIEKLHRHILNRRITDLSSFINQRDKIEGEMFELADKAKTDEDKANVMEYGKHSEKLLYEELTTLVNEGCTKKARIKGNIYYNRYWKAQNKSL